MALLKRILGRSLALEVARHLVVFLKRPGGQAQFRATLLLQKDGDQFGDLHAWIVEHLTADLSVAALAARVGMSERSLMRIIAVTPQAYREHFASRHGNTDNQ